MPRIWQEICPCRQFCHSWRDRCERSIVAMTALILIALVTALVVSLERHHRRTWGLPRAPHGADSTIAFTDLDHDWDRVWHDAAARR
jgi:hypothetical protein